MPWTWGFSTLFNIKSNHFGSKDSGLHGWSALGSCGGRSPWLKCWKLPLFLLKVEQFFSNDCFLVNYISLVDFHSWKLFSNFQFFVAFGEIGHASHSTISESQPLWSSFYNLWSYKVYYFCLEFMNQSNSHGHFFFFNKIGLYNLPLAGTSQKWYDRQLLTWFPMVSPFWCSPLVSSLPFECDCLQISRI